VFTHLPDGRGHYQPENERSPLSKFLNGRFSVGCGYYPYYLLPACISILKPPFSGAELCVGASEVLRV
jgi:hypothetical protein